MIVFNLQGKPAVELYTCTIVCKRFSVQKSFVFSVQALVATAVFYAALLGCSSVFAQADPINDKLAGDVGLAAYVTQSVIRGKGNDTTVLPYLFADYGKFFARIDTFGLKTVPLGYGYLELIGRVSVEGWRANTAALGGLKDRKTPLPLGVGTFQQTPYGGLIVNAFVDANKSRGTLIEATYVAEFKLGGASIFPQLGIEHRSAKYSNYLYGVSSADTLASGYATYNAAAASTPILGLGIDVPLGDSPWVINVELRRKWLSSSISNSPLVVRKTQDNAWLALSYRFK